MAASSEMKEVIALTAVRIDDARSLLVRFMYYSTTRLNRPSKAYSNGEMLYDMARTFSLTKHRPVFSRLFTRHRFLMLFLFLLATLIAIRTRKAADLVITRSGCWAGWSWLLAFM
jgi:hypothetical protein